MVHGFILVSLNLKQPQLEPLPIVTDPQSLQHARSQIAEFKSFCWSRWGNK